ncbi:MAG TPA: hypothetical protein VNJ01_04970 [Bacteriovoracaceae bacterium]|nr:hypothetical protein [Bacteriovoracaceae bacterium]
MLKYVFFFCLFIIASCQQSTECQDPEGKCPAETSQVPVPLPGADPLPEDEISNDALLFDASVDFTNFDHGDEAKVLDAIRIIQEVVRSKEFRERVINFSYQGKRAFVDNGGLSNGQIYQMILNGSEDLSVGVDHEMDLELELYTSKDNVVGYTYPNILKIYMNTKYFDVYTPTEVAGNIFHEWTHKLGFQHSFRYSVARDASVPYAIGYLIEELGKQYE